MEFLLLGIVMSLGINSFATCTLSRRSKRFLLPPGSSNVPPFSIPTTYPIPTLPARGASAQNIMITPVNGNQTVLAGNLLLASVQVPCPHKRDAARERITLDDALMKQIYSMLAENMNFTRKGHRHVQNNRLQGTLKKINNYNQEKQFSVILKKDAERYRDWLHVITSEIRSRQDKQLSETDDDGLSYILAETNLTKNQLGNLLGLTNDIDIVKSVYVPENRVKRDSSGTVTRVEYCTHRGSPTGDGYLHMCTTCATTTQFPEDSFPRYINEAICDTNDCNCFTVSGTAHGRCQPIIRHTKILRRKPGACRLLVQDGRQMILDDWELIDQPTHAGCECVMNKNSVFATLVLRR